MKIAAVDERRIGQEHTGADFVVFVYEGTTSWSVDSYLLRDATLTEVLGWLGETLPEDACYAVGVVLAPSAPASTSPSPSAPASEPDLHVAWVIGADVLNTDVHVRDDADQRIAAEMLARRGRVTIP